MSREANRTAGLEDILSSEAVIATGILNDPAGAYLPHGQLIILICYSPHPICVFLSKLNLLDEDEILKYSLFSEHSSTALFTDVILPLTHHY